GNVMAVASVSHPPFHKSLYFKVLLAILIGVVLGVMSPTDPKIVPESMRGLILLPLGWAEAMKPFGDAFIKMLIAPIIFCTVVHGIANVGDMKKVGRVGLKALLYFEFVTTLALVVGLIVINTLRPGAGMN